MDSGIKLGSAGPKTEPPQTPNDRPQVVNVSSEHADFQPGRNTEARGGTSPVSKG